MLKRRNRVRCVFLQWEFRLGSAAAAGKALGPLGGVGSGPQVEKMVEAMDSWNGLCLDYRCSVFIVASFSRPILKRLDRSFRLVGGRFFISGLINIVVGVYCAQCSRSRVSRTVWHKMKSFNRKVPPCAVLFWKIILNHNL